MNISCHKNKINGSFDNIINNIIIEKIDYIISKENIKYDQQPPKNQKIIKIMFLQLILEIEKEF